MRESVRATIASTFHITMPKISYSLIALLALVAPALVSCGGGRLEELLKRDEILAVDVSPHSVPRPIEGADTEFKVNVRVYSREVLRSVSIDVDQPNSDPNRTVIARTSVCFANTAPCGETVVEIRCRSAVEPTDANLRRISCGFPYASDYIVKPKGAASLHVSVADHSIIALSSLGVDDSQDFSIDIL